MIFQNSLKTLCGEYAVLLVPVDPELLDRRTEPDYAAVNPSLFSDEGFPRVLRRDGQPGLLHGGHERREANVPDIPSEGFLGRVDNALLYDGDTLVGEEVFAPARQGVRLDDQPSAV